MSPARFKNQIGLRAAVSSLAQEPQPVNPFCWPSVVLTTHQKKKLLFASERVTSSNWSSNIS